MPSQFRSTLNQLIQATVSAVEVNSGTWSFAAYALPRLTGARIMVHGLVWGANVQAADRPNAHLVLFLQRGLIIDNNTVFPGAVDAAQQIFQYSFDLAVSQPQPWFPARPLPLEPGDSYALVLVVVPLAPFVGFTNLSLTVFGNAEAAVEDDFSVKL